MKALFVVGCAAVLAAPSVVGCDLCAVYAAAQARGEVGRGPFVGLAEQFTHFGTVQVDGHDVGNPSGQYLDSSISQVFAGYNFGPRLGVQFNLPVIYRSYRRPNGAGGIEHGTVSGIGDCSLLLNVSPIQRFSEKFTLNWSLLAGIKFPTGDSSRISEELNEVEEPVGPPSGIHGHDLTLGTGSYDGMVGSSIYVRKERLFLGASVQYAIRSEGDFHYQFANDLTWSGGPGCVLMLQENYTFSIQAVVSGEYKGKDSFEGKKAEDTGVTAVYLGPQLVFTWKENLSAQVGADLPITIQNTSLQTVPDYRIRASLTWHF
jgi:hypothetical protein